MHNPLLYNYFRASRTAGGLVELTSFWKNISSTIIPDDFEKGGQYYMCCLTPRQDQSLILYCLVICEISQPEFDSFCSCVGKNQGPY